MVAVAGDRLIINGENGKAQTRIVQAITGRVITVSVAFDEIAPQNVWVIDAQDLATLKFRVLSVVQSDSHQFTITALEYNPKSLMQLIMALIISMCQFQLLIPIFKNQFQILLLQAKIGWIKVLMLPPWLCLGRKQRCG